MVHNHKRDIPVISGIREVAEHYDLFICDLWGVIHNGLQAHNEAVATIENLRSAGKHTVFLSNAPRPRSHVREQLVGMGVPAGMTDFIVTSGGLARDAVRENWRGAKLYHLGPSSDRNTVEGLDIQEVQSPSKADVILATGLDFNTIEKHRDWLTDAAINKAPLLCANPDRVVHVGEKLYLCAGSVADLYAEMGGPVVWFGKPTPASLLSCADECGIPQPAPERCIMIGDSLQTDIAGAQTAGFDSLLIAAGIHREEWPDVMSASTEGGLPDEAFAHIFGAQKPRPTCIMEVLRW